MRQHETTDSQVRGLAKAPAKATAADQRHSGFARVSIVSPDSKELITERRLNAVYTDARAAPGLLVGYLPSFDKTLGGALAALGIEAKELTVAGIQGGSLADYSAIVIDNRGYQAHPELVAANARLLDYVRNGGTLIVFYQKANEWNPDQGKGRPQLAPYAIILGNARVTDENSVVRFLQPRHPLLLYPNRIGSTDFKNWIQERGLYYPTEWDSHYTALLATSDPGEAPRRDGLLAARYGSGQ